MFKKKEWNGEEPRTERIKKNVVNYMCMMHDMNVNGRYVSQDEISSKPVKIRDNSHVNVLTWLSFLGFEGSKEV